MLKIKNLFKKEKFLVSVLVLLCFFQLVFGFLFPIYGFNDNWLQIQTYLPKFEVKSLDNALLERFLPFISSEYRLISDAGHYLETGRYFNAEFFENSPILDRPLYSGLIFLSSLPIRLFAAPSYGIIFGLAILVNFFLLVLAVILFFSLLKKIFSLRVAFLSSILLIFSPYVRSSLSQPVVEILMVPAMVISAYCLYDYIKKPSSLKFIIFSLIIGILMLGKMFYAIPLFIFLLAVYFRQYVKAAVFLMISFSPVILWYLWVTRILKIPYYIHEVQYYREGIWIFHAWQMPWHQIYKFLLESLPNFFEVLIFSFLLIPIIFSIIGFRELPFRSRSIFYFGPIFSLFLFSLAVNIYYYRLTFLLFPVIYPTCVLGIEKIAASLKRYGRYHGPIFYAAVIGLIILISSVNFYKVFSYY